jgi:RimJ/RimL family protein N-acetyltransferase
VRQVPIIETARLLMRGWDARDFDAYACSNADPVVQRYFGGPQDRGSGRSSRAADGRLLGRAGLWHPEGWFGLEVGWKLHRETWGRGYATEAAAAALDWAWADVDAERIISVIHPENAASLRVAGRLGMYHLRDAESSHDPVVIMAIDRPT